MSIAKLLILSLAVTSSTAAFVDEVVKDSNSSSSTTTSPWSGGAEVSFNDTSGNVHIQTLGAAGRVTLRSEPLTTSLKAGFLRNSTEHVERLRNLFGNLRTGMNLANNIDVFAQGNYLQNRFSGIDRQWLGTVGLGIYAWNAEASHLRFEGGFGYMNEGYIPPTDANRASFLVGTAGANLGFKLSEVADFENDLLFIENFKTSKDWRVQNIASLSSAITSFMSLKVSYNLTKRNRAVTGFEGFDSATSGALVFKF